MDGIILIDKPVGMSSFKAISILKRKLKLDKVGHCGTLDPFASGLLVVCVNRATKVNQFLLDSDKVYIATLKLGEATDTLDLEGKVIEQSPVPQLSKEQIEEVFLKLTGISEQIPPMYSALKQDGKRLYELARKDITVERLPRKIEIFSLKLIEFTPSTITFEVHCSKGTYVRVLGETIAKQLNTLGHLIALRRTRISNFKIEDATNIDDETAKILPIITGLTHFPKVVLPENLVKDIKDGKPLVIDNPNSQILLVDEEDNCIAIYQKNQDDFRPLRGLW